MNLKRHFRLSEICECQDNLTSFASTFASAIFFTSDCIVDFKILRLDIDWSIDSDFSCIPALTFFPSKSKFCIQTESVITT